MKDRTEITIRKNWLGIILIWEFWQKTRKNLKTINICKLKNEKYITHYFLKYTVLNQETSNTKSDNIWTLLSIL